MWKSYLKKENTLELLLAVQQLKKLISSFYKNNPKKLTAIFPFSFLEKKVLYVL